MRIDGVYFRPDQVELLKKKLELLDIEFAIATNVIETETGKKIDLPEEIEILFDRYWRYILSRLEEEFGFANPKLNESDKK